MVRSAIEYDEDVGSIVKMNEQEIVMIKNQIEKAESKGKEVTRYSIDQQTFKKKRKPQEAVGNIQVGCDALLNQLKIGALNY